MALFDDVSTLEDALGRPAETAEMNIEQQFAKKRRQAVSKEAKTGRLGSGVSNYTLADLDANEIAALGDVESELSSSLGQVPANDYVREEEFKRKEALAELIGSLNRKRKGGIVGVLSGAGTGATSGAAFGPYGAVGGGVLGGVLGGL